tara:strand:+ start:423 stop:1442 length:1020 start_codon:yes stop_codon:yes gene_type:complete
MRNVNNIVLITGCAGFIGAALSKKFINEGFKVYGIDNLNNYYDKNLKIRRLKDIEESLIRTEKNWKFFQISLEDKNALDKLFLEIKPNIVINLAAQAGVRYSIKNPNSYVTSNLIGFFNILENCKIHNIDHLVYASSSSVYGANHHYPFSENQKVNMPLSFYAATKLSNEMMAFSYSNIYKIPITGLRYFTVYGPWGRPDMAPMIFSKKILLKEPISVFNYGRMKRDFTFIDDIVEGTYLCAIKPPMYNSKLQDYRSRLPNKIFNIGFGSPVDLEYFIELLEYELSIKAIRKYEPIQIGDVEETFADTNELEKWIGYKPKVSIEKGVAAFSKWYKNYFT